MEKTFYLWDLADTLFPERWDAEKSGVPNFDAYVESLGYDLKTISPRDYEWCYERPYKKGLFDVTIADGFREVLAWAKYNGVFTTGNREQIDWRAQQLQKKYGFDIHDYIKEIYSTFDYGNTNVKTSEMLKDILQKKRDQEFDVVVYIDDKLKNCEFFNSAVEGCAHRAYHLLNDDRGFRDAGKHLQIGNLYDLMEHEKKFRID